MLQGAQEQVICAEVKNQQWEYDNSYYSLFLLSSFNLYVSKTGLRVFPMKHMDIPIDRSVNPTLIER